MVDKEYIEREFRQLLDAYLKNPKDDKYLQGVLYGFQLAMERYGDWKIVDEVIREYKEDSEREQKSTLAGRMVRHGVKRRMRNVSA